MPPVSVIRHAYLRLNEDQRSDAAMQEVLERTRALAALPMVQSFQVLVAADAAALGAWDLCLVLGFSDLAAFEAYRVHPDHRRYVDVFLKPRLQVLKAWNFAPSA